MLFIFKEMTKKGFVSKLLVNKIKNTLNYVETETVGWSYKVQKEAEIKHLEIFPSA